MYVPVVKDRAAACGRHRATWTRRRRPAGPRSHDRARDNRSGRRTRPRSSRAASPTRPRSRASARQCPMLRPVGNAQVVADGEGSGREFALQDRRFTDPLGPARSGAEEGVANTGACSGTRPFVPATHIAGYCNNAARASRWKRDQGRARCAPRAGGRQRTGTSSPRRARTTDRSRCRHVATQTRSPRLQASRVRTDAPSSRTVMPAFDNDPQGWSRVRRVPECAAGPLVDQACDPGHGRGDRQRLGCGP